MKFYKNIFAAVLITSVAGNFILRAQDSSAPDTNPPDAALPTDIVPGSALAQVVQLAQAGVDESVILSYIKSSNQPFNLTTDQIIYLKDLGLPNDAATAMMARDQQLGVTSTPMPVTTAAAPTDQTETAQPVEVTQNYFYDTLSPYGGWVNISGYGLCWRPTVAVYDTGWQPYCDHGHWVYTDDGWFWFSDYGWGGCAFHYGRWFHHERYGWCWWPDTTWAPSWVTWRYANDYCGWAPLPPHTIYRPGAGIYYNGVAVSANFNFGLGANFFVFVPTAHFNEPHPRRYRVAPTQVTTIYNHTTIINNFSGGPHDRIVINHGIPPERITSVTHKQITTITIRDTSTPISHGEKINHDTLLVHRPQISEQNVSTLNRGVKPPVVRENNFHSTPNNFQSAPNNQNSRPENFHQNNFSQPNNNRTSQQNFSAPSQHFNQPETHSAPVQNQPAQNFNSYNHAVSPKQQQVDEQSHFNSVIPGSSHYNSTVGGNSHYNSPVEQPTPVVPPQHSTGNEQVHSASHGNNSVPAPAPRNPPAQQQQQQKSDKDKNGP